MTPQERKVFELALEALKKGDYALVNAICEELKQAQPEQEPININHKHEWFRTGEMKVGQMRCISCGTWGQEEMPQRTWVGLTDGEYKELHLQMGPVYYYQEYGQAIEAKLKEKNT